MRRKTVSGGVLLFLSVASRFGRTMLEIIGLAGVADDAPAWIRALEDPWFYGTLLIAGLAMLGLALRDRIVNESGSEGGRLIQTSRSAGNTVQAGRDVENVGNVFFGRLGLHAAEDVRIKAVDAADRAARALTPDGTERAAGDFRSALAEIERIVEDAPSSEVVLPLIQDLRRGSSPPYEFARPDFKAKLDQLMKNRAVAEPPRASTTAGLTWKIIERGMVAEKAVALLRVEATGELPQPLELYVRCAGGQATPSASLIPDPARPTEQDRSAELEVWDPGGAKDFRMKLVAPKLRPPSRLDIVLRSVGNAEIRVVEVRRALGVGET